MTSCSGGCGEESYWKQRPCELYYFLLEKQQCVGSVAYGLEAVGRDY